MKKLQSITEGTWIELKPIQLTEEQKIIMVSEDVQAKTELITLIKSQREVIAEISDSELAQSKYTEIKPVLKTTDNYQLISMDVMINNQSMSGILNYRVNEKHKQIRF
jgi:hypothetical protein